MHIVPPHLIYFLYIHVHLLLRTLTHDVKLHFSRFTPTSWVIGLLRTFIGLKAILPVFQTDPTLLRVNPDWPLRWVTTE